MGLELDLGCTTRAAVWGPVKPLVLRRAGGGGKRLVALRVVRMGAINVGPIRLTEREVRV